MDNIRELRQKQGLSQQQLADKLGVSQQAVAQWENGERKPRTEKLQLLAEILHCTIDELFE